MRSLSPFLSLCLLGAFSGSASLRAQNPLPSSLAQQIDAAHAAIAQPSLQNDGSAWWRLGILEQDAARYQQAEHCYQRAITLLENKDPETLANALDSAGTLYVEIGDYAHAEPLELRALSIRQTRNDATGEGRSWMHLAVLSLGRHDNAAALRYAQLAKHRLVDAKPENSIAASPEEKMTALTDLALALCADGHCDRAISPLKQARRIAAADTSTAGTFPAGFIDFLTGYADWRTGDTTHAARLMKTGIAAMESTLGFGHPTYIQALSQYHAFLEQTGDFTAAIAVRDKLARFGNATQLARADSGSR